LLTSTGNSLVQIEKTRESADRSNSVTMVFSGA
jgi:hypothetical protein